MPPQEDRPPLRVPKLAQQLGVSEDTVLRSIRRGQIKANKVGRVWLIPAPEVDRLMGIACGGTP